MQSIRFGIRTKFLLLISVIFLGISLPTLFYWYQQEQTQVESQIGEHAHLIGRYLASISTEAINAYDFLRLAEK
jgi:hypothetical protein